ncbi:hypothetical protein HPB52_022987 [Rhipicephalus sanguineus]|uniref:Uncharacterized protein n=1 Tax=Rhipicephalus sanguineus TaxID=34632 RepID=A0A9D4PRR5_RHISA|nr:hypothetical protein HPB52_022987 [Rhipicephalus sanguineus]
MRLDAVNALNGVKAQPLMHTALHNAVPVELFHLAAVSSSSPRPNDDLCAAVLACCGETYRPLPGSREFQVSPPSQRAVPTGPQPSLDQDLTPPATTASYGLSYDGPTSSWRSGAGMHAPVADSEVGPSYESPSRVPAIHTSSPTSTAPDKAKTSDSTTATLPHALDHRQCHRLTRYSPPDHIDAVVDDVIQTRPSIDLHALCVEQAATTIVLEVYRSTRSETVFG